MRSILITGCSSGIGLDAARSLRDRGWTVLASCRKAEDCARLAGEGFAAPRIDYEDAASIESGWAEAMEATGGTLDALLNNGAYAIPSLVEDLPVEALRAIMEANFLGWHDLTRRAIPVMRAGGAGRIVQCSSVLGYAATPWRGAYVSTKFALEGYSDALRMEVAPHGIHVSLVEPGPIRTAFRRNALAQFRRWIDWETSPNRATYDRLLERQSSDAQDRWELGPEAVTAAVVHAVEAPRPRTRYRVTVPAHGAAWMRRALPDRLLDRILSSS
ncbi:SDR family NAD(P)-dependent oxidoreductase [Jannaschia sp. Os4]|uniref:SDR family NAD(P)-dependent oxidoreductase n=1 Tax=Jannaschia sp. Os4 TaxID=2807617 RepID=UPI0019398B56|nr:SDR family NAD(P)-dependent oxidoreductase [Jannaschia sp. Os4]MBM2577175.1 SDR family NAD(P)-dependent oxidoreductase [Jannaschia sp. Os4]